MLLEAGKGCPGPPTEMGLRPILIHYNHAVLTFDPPLLKIRPTGIFNNYTISRFKRLFTFKIALTELNLLK